MWEFNKELKDRKESLINGGYDAYCLFTLSGLEINIANELNKLYDYCLATPLLKMAHRSKNGVRYDVEEVLLSGYIFVYLPKDREINYLRSNSYYFKILSNKNDNGRLNYEDLEYAKWVLDVEGLLTMSQALKIDGKVRIVNGPLKKLEGHIVEYSKKNRNCCIEIELLGRTIKTWLPFEWIDFDTEDLKTR